LTNEPGFRKHLGREDGGPRHAAVATAAAEAAEVRGETTRSTNMRTDRAIRSAPERDAMRRWRGRPAARPVYFLHVGKTGGTAFKNSVRAEGVENLRKWYDEDYRFLDLCREIMRVNPRIRAKKRWLRERLLGWG